MSVLQRPVPAGFDDPEVMTAVAEVARDPSAIKKYAKNAKVRRLAIKSVFRRLLSSAAASTLGVDEHAIDKAHVAAATAAGSAQSSWCSANTCPEHVTCRSCRTYVILQLCPSKPTTLH